MRSEEMTPLAKIFVVTRDIALENSVVELLLRAGCSTGQARSVVDALKDWRRDPPADYVLVDGRLPADDLRALLDGLGRSGAAVVMLSDGATPAEVRDHEAVVRELEPPWSMDRLMRLIDWMDGEDPAALDPVSYPPRATLA